MAQAQAKAAKKTAEPAGGPNLTEQNPPAEPAGGPNLTEQNPPAELGEEGVTTADVAALVGVEQEQAEPDELAAEPAAAPSRVFVNEGMRAEIDQKGFTHDPATGRKVTREDLAGVVRGY